MKKAINHNFIRSLTNGLERDCIKVETVNLICRSTDDFSNFFLPTAVMTKKQPNGYIYGSAFDWSVVIRWLDGQLLRNDLVDAYAWDMEKILKNIEKAVVVGVKTYEETAALLEMLDGIKSNSERELLFQYIRRNAETHQFLAITSAEEARKVIEITPELYFNGLTTVVDERVEPDESGECIETKLNIGDFLIVSNDGYYCIRREEFLLTHKF